MCVTLKLPSFRFSGFTLFFSFSDSLDASAQVILILIPKVITHLCLATILVSTLGNAFGQSQKHVRGRLMQMLCT